MQRNLRKSYKSIINTSKLIVNKFNKDKVLNKDHQIIPMNANYNKLNS